ncbi:MAG: nucleotidyltransferase [Oscillospiraceae bacterium]|nr:nucleotidyltransferase [Oscillospiraceae bacterium]
MNSPTLCILAAGMGSRFGGLKQITAVDEYNHAIIDFSLYDAYRAGFRRVCFIIKHQIEDDFKARIGKRIEKYFDVQYVFQELDKLPEGYSVPEGRVKPWGTGHAVACCADVIDGPFAVINADDFYGPTAYQVLYDFLADPNRAPGENAMVAYQLKNTVTENGYVARGICSVSDGVLTGVQERTHIEKRGENAAYTEDGTNYLHLSGEVPVSMNFWGFGSETMHEFVNRFPAWLDENLASSPLKAEYFLPLIPNAIIQEKLGCVKVLDCSEKWHGVTYKEDLPDVIAAIAQMRKDGLYPEKLLD